MRAWTWLLWLTLGVGAAWLAWSRVPTGEERLEGSARASESANPQADSMPATPGGPLLVGVGGWHAPGAAGSGLPKRGAAATERAPTIELQVVDDAGRAVPRFLAWLGAAGCLGSHGQVTIALAFPGSAAPLGPYDVLVCGACDEAGVGLDLGAALVQVATCDGGPVRVVLPVVDALTVQVRDEAGSGVPGLQVRLVAPAVGAGDPTPEVPPWPANLRRLSVGGVTGADGSVRLARPAPHLTVAVECDVPRGFLPCGAPGVKALTGRLDLELRRGRAVDLLVESPWGALPAATVSLKSAEHAGGVGGSYYERRETDHQGRVRFELLDPRARYTLIAHDPLWGRPRTRVEKMFSGIPDDRLGRPELQRLPGDEPVHPLAPLVIASWVPGDMTLRLNPAVRLQGLVRDSWGEPVTDAILRVHAGGQCVGALETDRAGRFVWDEPPDGVLELHLAFEYGEDGVFLRTVAPTERDGLVLQIEGLAQRVLDITFPNAVARDEAGGFLGSLDVAVRVAGADGTWGPFGPARVQLVPLDGADGARGRLRIDKVESGARAEVLLWQQDVGFVHVALPALGAQAHARLERGDAVDLATSRARTGDTWRVRLEAEGYAGLEFDAFVTVQEDGRLRVGGLPMGRWKVHATPMEFSERSGFGPAYPKAFEGTLHAEAHTGERTIATEVPREGR